MKIANIKVEYAKNPQMKFYCQKEWIAGLAILIIASTFNYSKYKMTSMKWVCGNYTGSNWILGARIDYLRLAVSLLIQVNLLEILMFLILAFYSCSNPRQHPSNCLYCLCHHHIQCYTVAPHARREFQDLSRFGNNNIPEFRVHSSGLSVASKFSAP